ncbi:MAG TPA: winged helix-turn-helix domain-containing protein [Streptosporangiaceae bacterium]
MDRGQIKHGLARQDGQLAWQKVASDITARIRSGELKPGTRLRSEHDLAEFYEVSFGTVRRAMKHLRDENLIVTQWGSGNFVAQRARPTKSV